MNSSISNLLSEFESLNLNDKEYVAEMIKKQLVECRREYLAARVSEARGNYKTGQVKKGSFNDLMQDLEND